MWTLNAIIPTLRHTNGRTTVEIVDIAMRRNNLFTCGIQKPRILVRPARAQSDRSSCIVLLATIVITRHFERIFSNWSWHNDIGDVAVLTVSQWIVRAAGADIAVEDSGHADRPFVIVPLGKCHLNWRWKKECSAERKHEDLSSRPRNGNATAATAEERGR